MRVWGTEFKNGEEMVVHVYRTVGLVVTYLGTYIKSNSNFRTTIELHVVAM
jgi:hypothetical protein